MIKLKIISFFLISLLTLQVLPLRQIGNMLSQNQWTEELPHNVSDDDCKPDLCNHLHHPYLPPAGYAAVVTSSSDSKTIAYIHFSDQIPSNHSAEIVIPPPDTVV